MNYQESREYIDKITREIPSVLGLEHMRELMKRLGNPQDDLKYVHVPMARVLSLLFCILFYPVRDIALEDMFRLPYIPTEAGWKFREAGSAERTLLLILHRCLMLLLL